MIARLDHDQFFVNLLKINIVFSGIIQKLYKINSKQCYLRLQNLNKLAVSGTPATCVLIDVCGVAVMTGRDISKRSVLLVQHEATWTPFFTHFQWFPNTATPIGSTVRWETIGSQFHSLIHVAGISETVRIV